VSTLQDSVCDRLIADDYANKAWALVLLAALEGDAALAAYLDGTSTIQPPAPSPLEAPDPATSASEPPGVFVGSVSVAGFRGIGPAATLTFKPGPGLTLVVGRNGSGKSSFAEALECLFTGTSYRWDGRPAPWKTGWKNLHESGKASLEAELVVEGRGTMTMSRTWHGDGLADAATQVTAKGQKAQPLSTLGWDASLATFRPFLSYNELGSLMDEGPSKLYDALSSVLGLDELTAVQNRLSTARKQREGIVTASKNGAKELAQKIAAVETQDERCSRALAAMAAKGLDLAALADLVGGDPAPSDSALSRLRQIASLALPDTDAIAGVVGRLRSAERAYVAVAATDAARARQRADLLEAAVAVHAANAQQTDCPVCGAKKRLSDAWLRATQMEITALRDEARGFDSAVASRTSAIRDSQRFITQPPPVLAQATTLGLATLASARTAWSTWGTARDLTDATALADHFEQHVLALSDAVAALVAEAGDEARTRDDAWKPVASAIAEWLPTARKAHAAASAIADLKDAEKWWKDVSEQMRNERFAPIEGRALDIWRQLRLQSNVDLGGVDLEGTGTKRKVALRVTVDGTPAEAVGVMSQGELHALALSLFLPRATLPESPFRFIAIDDPVQSMDPARVDGLARVLGETAKTRQVIVFTHDDRLPEAVRRLGIPSTVHTVTRRDRSAVDVQETMDPVFAYIDDARALVKTPELPAAVTARVVPGFCRSAIEAACMEKVRQRRLGKGATHDDVEQLLTANPKTHPLMALALFDDETRTSEVLQRLNKMGSWAGDVFKACKEGAHEAFSGDPADLVDGAKKLTALVRALP